MKRFHELTRKQRRQAIDYAGQMLASGIINGLIRLPDRDKQARIEAVVDGMSRDQPLLPFSAHVWKRCREDLITLAEIEARATLYLEAGEHGTHISSLEKIK